MSDFRDLVISLNPVMSRVFTRGTIDVWDSYLRTTTLPIDGRWGSSKQRFGIQHTASPTIVNDAAEQQGTTGTLFVEMAPLWDTAAANSLQRLVSKRSGAGEMWRLLVQRIGGTRYIIFSDGIAFPLFTYDWRGCRGITATFASGAAANFYCDGSPVGVAPAVTTVAAAAVPINIGSSYLNTEPVLTPMHCAIQFPTILTPTQISDLHTEFTRSASADLRESRRVVVPVSINPAGITDTETFGAALSSAGTLVGKRGVSVGTPSGPITQTKKQGQAYLVGNTSDSFVDLTNPSTLIPVDNGALCTVVVPTYSTIPSTRYIFLGNASSNTLLNQSTLGAIVGAKGTPSVQISSPNGTTHAGVPLHLVLTWWLDGAVRRFQLFVDGVSIGESVFTGTNVATLARIFGSTGLGWSGATPGTRFYSSRITPTQARQLYLESSLAGASLDNVEQMPPVTFTVKSSGNIGPWNIGSGSWVNIDNGTGRRVLMNITAGWAARPCPTGCSAFGAWYCRLSKTGGSSVTTVLVSASVRGARTDSSQNGYTLAISSDESVRLIRTTGGASVNLVVSAASYIALGTEYEFFMSRRYDGLFTLYIRGGAYTTWTVVGSATDTTYTTTNFVIADIDSLDTLTSFSFFPHGGTLLPTDVPGLED